MSQPAQGIRRLANEAEMPQRGSIDTSQPFSVTEINKGAFEDCGIRLLITTERDTCAAQYCRENTPNYTYPNADDWLWNWLKFPPGQVPGLSLPKDGFRSSFSPQRAKKLPLFMIAGAKKNQ